MQCNALLLRYLFALGIVGCAVAPAAGIDDAPLPRVFKAFSPNFDNRPAGAVIDTVVIHATATPTWREAVRHFGKHKTRVSSHYTVTRDGRIIRHVLENKRAWHAGVSRMPDGRENVNDFSIGIELVNLNDGKDPYSPEQLHTLGALLSHLYQTHPIATLISHAAVALPPGRSSDPAGLDLALLPQPTRRPSWRTALDRSYLSSLWIAAGVMLLICIEIFRRFVPRTMPRAPQRLWLRR